MSQPTRIPLLAVAAAAVSALVSLLLAGCSTPSTGTAAAQLPTPFVAPTAQPTQVPTTTTPPPTTDPGLLPQTHVLPSADDPAFQAGVRDLWQAIVTDDPAVALSFFFPETAYQQIKAIANPAADYQDRLIEWYRLDIQAAHAFLGASASSATFVQVTVPTSAARWILPGVEANKGSYYRVFGTRLYYRVGTTTKSIGIFSLISWRGEWYIVHLGPSIRSSNRGIVYDPIS